LIVLEQSADHVVESRRVGVAPVPADLGKYLNNLQMAGLKEVEPLGWSLKYIRRPAFQKPCVVLVYSDGAKLGLLEEDGSLNESPGIPRRGVKNSTAGESRRIKRKATRYIV
jgi:hypothetical protein